MAQDSQKQTTEIIPRIRVEIIVAKTKDIGRCLVPWALLTQSSRGNMFYAFRIYCSMEIYANQLNAREARRQVGPGN